MLKSATETECPFLLDFCCSIWSSMLLQNKWFLQKFHRFKVHWVPFIHKLFRKLTNFLGAKFFRHISSVLYLVLFGGAQTISRCASVIFGLNRFCLFSGHSSATDDCDRNLFEQGRSCCCWLFLVIPFYAWLDAFRVKSEKRGTLLHYHLQFRLYCLYHLLL